MLDRYCVWNSPPQSKLPLVNEGKFYTNYSERIRRAKREQRESNENEPQFILFYWQSIQVMNWLGSIAANQTTILRSHFCNLFSSYCANVTIVFLFILRDKSGSKWLKNFAVAVKGTQYETERYLILGAHLSVAKHNIMFGACYPNTCTIYCTQSSIRHIYNSIREYGEFESSHWNILNVLSP